MSDSLISTWSHDGGLVELMVIFKDCIRNKPMPLYIYIAKIFRISPILVFCWNKNLRDIIGTKLIKNDKVKRIFTNKIQVKYTPCLANNRTLCCKQIVHSTTFRSNHTSRIFQICHNLNCKISMSFTCWKAPNVK